MLVCFGIGFGVLALISGLGGWSNRQGNLGDYSLVLAFGFLILGIVQSHLEATRR